MHWLVMSLSMLPNSHDLCLLLLAVLSAHVLIVL